MLEARFKGRGPGFKCPNFRGWGELMYSKKFSNCQKVLNLNIVIIVEWLNLRKQ